MYCILVTGIPASGKSTMAEYLSEALCIPMLSKDKIKEILFDTIGFHSRAEKVALGTGAMEIMYYFAEQMMKTGQPFIKEWQEEMIPRTDIWAILSMTVTPDRKGKRAVLSIRSPHRRTLSVESQSGAWWISGFRVLLWRLTPRIFLK